MSVQLDVPDHPGEQFTGRLIGNSGAVNQASGALLAQFEVDNPKGELLPGAYAEVHLPMADNSHGGGGMERSCTFFLVKGS